ncbi:MAG: hypothetical protein DPW09_39050 [Anaerolineae bacterium]|nr:hypothetical protein [Anaerolineales bacterium]MCQ3979454.1 hypothetical protein [Anaerolineae bacterium]
MARTESNSTESLLSAKVAAAHARREALKGMGTANVLPTTYYAPTRPQTEDLLVALVADADWRNEIEQEEASGNTVFVFRKRNLTVGEQPTIIRYGYSAQVEDIVLTVTGAALPNGFSLDGVKPHEIVTAEKANDKRKAAVKADKKRADAFAKLGF